MTAPSRGRWKAGLLGLFVTWQLVYLPTANLVQFVPLGVRADPGDIPLTLQTPGRFTNDDRLQTLADVTGAGLTRYAEASGQVQFWKLFTPGLPPQSIVLVTRIEWPDGRHVDVVSPTAPSSAVMFRLPRKDLRPFHFDASVGLGPWAVTPDWVTNDPASARALTVDWAKIRPHSVRLILHHHWAAYRADHPTEPNPTSLTLVTRLLSTTGEVDGRAPIPAVSDRPFVRWVDPFGPNPRMEAFDPVAGAFVSLPEGRP
jgi:hypothetical protein